MKFSTFSKISLLTFSVVAFAACGQQPSEVEQTTTPTANANSVTTTSYTSSPATR